MWRKEAFAVTWCNAFSSAASSRSAKPCKTDAPGHNSSLRGSALSLLVRSNRLIVIAFLLRVMKDDPQGVTMARAQSAHTVPHVNAIAAAFALHWTVVYRESYSITLTKRNDLWPRLHARTLFGKYKFSARKVAPRFRQQDRHLYGKNMLAVKVLMQTVVVALPILQQQRGWPLLSGIVASPEEFRMRLWIADFEAHQVVPAIGNLCQPWINGCSNFCNNLGQGTVEVLIFAPSKTMSRHDDAASKEAVVWIKRGQSLALIRR